MSLSTIEKFKRKILVDLETGCHNFSGSLNRGYGQITFCKNGASKTFRAHRVAWMIKYRKRIPQDKEIHHRCRNRSCVNPSHLQVVDHPTNMKKAAERGSWTGERNSQAKYTDNDVFIIKFLARIEGVSPKRIAAEMGMPERTAYYHASPKAWKHLEGFFTE